MARWDWRAVVVAWAVLAAGSGAWGAELRAEVGLSAQEVSGAEAEGKVFGGLLCRELERQAVLLAAREELGLRTRDAALGERLDGDGTMLNIVTHNIRGERSLVVLSMPAKKGEKAATGAEAKAAAAVGQAEFKLGKGLVDYAAFTSEAERQSRTDFVELLRKTGVMRGEPEAPTAWGNGAPGAEALAALKRMDPESQYEAVRLLHGEMREKGASVERVAALVRGYANLGFLTQFLWNADSKVFAARSLLYAERLVVHEKGSAASLEARAYARALAGLQRLAEEDLQKAGTSPEWKAAIDCWCRYDLDGELSEGVEGRPCRELATVLAAGIARDSSGPDRAKDIATDCLEVLPKSTFLRQVEWHTDILEVVLSEPEELMAAVPAEVRGAIERMGLKEVAAADGAGGPSGAGVAAAQTAAMAEALSKAGAEDAGEPSLGLLGLLVRDEGFVAAAEIGISARQRWEGPDDAIRARIEAVAPAWKGHPHAAFIGAMLVNDEQAGTGLVNAYKKWHPRDTGRWTYDNVFVETDLWHRINMNWFSSALASLDATALDYSPHVIDSIKDPEDVDRLEAARRESPYSALLFAGWLEHYGVEKRRENPAAAQKVIAEAEAHFATRPRVMGDAGEWACDLNDFKEGIGMMAGAMKEDPTVRVAQPLVEAYLHMGNVSAAKDIADQGLAVSNAKVMESQELAFQAARALIAGGHADEGWLYAKYAADSDSSWGYMIAAACQERMGNREEAAQWERRNAALYPSTAGLWELWAARTGDGSLEEAKGLAEAYAQKHPEAADNAWTAVAAGDWRKALKSYAHGEHGFDVNDWAIYAALAALAKDPRALEHGLTEMENFKKPFGRELAAAARGNQVGFALDHLAVLREADWRGEDAPAELSETAILLAATGRKAEALPLLKRALHGGGTAGENYAMAWEAAKHIGADPAALAAEKLPADEGAAFVGQWQAHVGGGAAVWTLAADGSVLTDQGGHGSWRAEDGKLVMYFSTHDWAVFAAGGGAGEMTGSSEKGPGTASLGKGNLP